MREAYLALGGNVGNFVGVGDVQQRSHHHGLGYIRPVSRVAHELHVERHKFPRRGVGGELVRAGERVARALGEHVRLTVKDELDGPFRQLRRNRGGGTNPQHPAALATEAAADTLHLDLDLVNGHGRRTGDGAGHIPRGLRGRDDLELRATVFRRADRPGRLEVKVFRAIEPHNALDHSEALLSKGGARVATYNVELVRV